MTVGSKHIVWDGKPATVRICYVRAWNDPEWRKVNEIKNGPRKGGVKPEVKR
jgi:hypothetical protein